MGLYDSLVAELRKFIEKSDSECTVAYLRRLGNAKSVEQIINGQVRFPSWMYEPMGGNERIALCCAVSLAYQAVQREGGVANAEVSRIIKCEHRSTMILRLLLYQLSTFKNLSIDK